MKTKSDFQLLSEQLIHYSCQLKKGEKILIDIGGNETELANCLQKTAYDVGAQVYLRAESQEVMREWLKGASEEQMIQEAKWQAERMSAMDAYIGLRARHNIYEWSDVPLDKIQMYNRLIFEPVHGNIRVPHTKWVVLRYPNASMAQEARMSTEAFREMYFKVCNLDYRQLSKAMDPLKELMDKTGEVRIKAPGTDLRFSIEGFSSVKCDGRCNIPDGEVYTAPVKDSVEGVISYNIPSTESGKVYDNVVLEFSRGKIVKASAGAKTEAINQVFDTDEGARYVGEFALGVNPHVLEPVNDILFDEKISGSIHFTPGSCYDDCSNGNKSAIHWDLVTILRKDYGGGEIWFDGKLIQKDGLFCLPELDGLNPATFFQKL